jgi:hypothetical protein
MRQDPAPITDTVLAGFDPDGTPLYVTAREAELGAIANCVLWILDHPHETFRALGMAALSAAWGYLAYESFRKPERKKPRRRAVRSLGATVWLRSDHS